MAQNSKTRYWSKDQYDPLFLKRQRRHDTGWGGWGGLTDEAARQSAEAMLRNLTIAERLG